MGRRQLYTMGEIAAAAGLSRQTVHAYARKGLIRAVEATPGGHLRFSARVVRRIDVIRALRAEHSLDEIRDLLRDGRGR
jgi:DNA-binding transcriptional MerR regulator